MVLTNWNITNNLLGTTKSTTKQTLLNWKPRRANYVPISSSALTAKVTIRQIQMHAHSGGIDLTKTGTIESNRNFTKAEVD